MHTKRFNRDCLCGVTAFLALTLAPGCELLVDFDRSLIPNDGGTEEASVAGEGGALQDGGFGDATTDADAASADAGDATVGDAAADGSEEASADASADAPLDDAVAPVDGSSDGATGDASSIVDGALADAGNSDDAADGM